MGEGHWTAKELEARHPDFTPLAERQSASYRLLSWCTYQIHWRDKRILRDALERCQQGMEIAQIIRDLDLGKTEDEAVKQIIDMVLPTVGKAETAHDGTLTELVRNHFSSAPFPVLVYLFCYFLPQFQPVPQVTPKKCSVLTKRVRENDNLHNLQVVLEHLFNGEILHHFRLVNKHGPLFAFPDSELIDRETEHLAIDPMVCYRMECLDVGRCVAIVHRTEGKKLGIAFCIIISKEIMPKPRSKSHGPFVEDGTQRWLRRSSHKALTIAWMPFNAVLAFLGGAFNSLKNRYYKRGYDTAVSDPNEALSDCREGMVHFALHDMWLLGETKSAGELQAIMEMSRSRIPAVMGISNLPAPARLGSQGQADTLCGYLGMILRRLLTPKQVNMGIPHEDWFVQKMIPLVEQEDAHILAVIDAVSMCVLTGRTDLAIQGLFGAGKSQAVAMLMLALLCVDTERQMHMLLVAKENSATKSFAQLLLALEPPVEVLERIGRLIGDKEAQRGAASATKLDINPALRQQAIESKQLLITTGGAFVNEYSMRWTGLRSWAETLYIACIDEAQQFGEEREVAAAALLPPACILLFTGDPFQTPGGIARNAQAFETRQCLLKTPHGLRSTQDARLPAELSGKLHSLLKASDHQDAAVIGEFLKQRTRPYQGMFAPMEPEEVEHDPGLARFSSVPTRYPDHLLEGIQGSPATQIEYVLQMESPMVALTLALEYLLVHPEVMNTTRISSSADTVGAGEHAWSLILPSSSRTPNIIYVPSVACRYVKLNRITFEGEYPHWEIGAKASGGFQGLPLGNISILWDAPMLMMHWLIQKDLNSLTDCLIQQIQPNKADGKVMLLMATRNKDKRSLLYSRDVRMNDAISVQTVSSSAGGTAAVGVVIQPTSGFLNKHHRVAKKSEDNYGRYTVANTRCRAATITVSPIDNSGMFGMAQTLGVFSLGQKGCDFVLPTPLSDDEMISMLNINEPPGWRSVPLAIRHTARGDYITDTTITTRLRLVLVDRKLLGKNIPKEIGILIDDGHQRKHPAIPKGQEKRTQPQILYGYARDHETQAVVVLLPGPELYQMDMWEVSRAKPFAYADTNNPFDPLTRFPDHISSMLQQLFLNLNILLQEGMKDMN